MRTQKETEYRTRILMEAYRAMIGNISVNMRKISLKWTDDDITIRTYFSHEPIEEEEEMISEIMTEIIAGLPNIKSCKEECLYSDKPLHDLEPFGEVIFLRNED